MRASERASGWLAPSRDDDGNAVHIGALQQHRKLDNGETSLLAFVADALPIFVCSHEPSAAAHIQASVFTPSSPGYAAKGKRQVKPGCAPSNSGEQSAGKRLRGCTTSSNLARTRRYQDCARDQQNNRGASQRNGTAKSEGLECVPEQGMIHCKIFNKERAKHRILIFCTHFTPSFGIIQTASSRLSAAGDLMKCGAIQ